MLARSRVGHEYGWAQAVLALSSVGTWDRLDLSELVAVELHRSHQALARVVCLLQVRGRQKVGQHEDEQQPPLPSIFVREYSPLTRVLKGSTTVMSFPYSS